MRSGRNLIALSLVICFATFADAQESLVKDLAQIQSKMVKVYGAGKIGGLESYQSGFFISDLGLLLTSWSTVLDVEEARIVTYDGKVRAGTLVGLDHVTELAVLKIDAEGYPFFDLRKPQEAEVGELVFGLSNLFGIAAGREPCSVQRGNIMAKSTLSAHRGRMATPYQGAILVTDVITNNPGAMGGALINVRGELVGIIGKELRDDATGNWINFAIPASVVSRTVQAILEGKPPASDPSESKRVANPHTLHDLGIAMIPNVVSKTPAYVDSVRPQSLAAVAGLQPNDLILTVNDKRVDSRKGLDILLATFDRADPIHLLVQRGNDLITLDIHP